MTDIISQLKGKVKSINKGQIEPQLALNTNTSTLDIRSD